MAKTKISTTDKIKSIIKLTSDRFTVQRNVMEVNRSVHDVWIRFATKLKKTKKVLSKIYSLWMTHCGGIAKIQNETNVINKIRQYPFQKK